METLYYVRHGSSELNLAGCFAGTTDTPLSEKGRGEAKVTGRQAQQLTIDIVVSSPLSRALATAEIIAGAIDYPSGDIKVEPLFRERYFGALEGTPWQPGLDLDSISGVESKDTLLQRAREARTWLLGLPQRHVLLVGHGSFGIALRSLFLTDKEFSNRAVGGSALAIPNAEIGCWLRTCRCCESPVA